VNEKTNKIASKKNREKGRSVCWIQDAQNKCVVTERLKQKGIWK